VIVGQHAGQMQDRECRRKCRKKDCLPVVAELGDEVVGEFFDGFALAMFEAFADAALGNEGGNCGEIVAGHENVACAVVTPFKVDGDADDLLLDEPCSGSL